MRPFRAALGLVLVGGLLAAPPRGQTQEPGDAARVKEILRARCLDCHGGRGKPRGSFKIFDPKDLFDPDRKIVVAKNPDESELFQRITATDGKVMPPSGQPRMAPDEVEAVRRWIAAGAAALPDDVADAPRARNRRPDPVIVVQSAKQGDEIGGHRPEQRTGIDRHGQHCTQDRRAPATSLRTARARSRCGG